MAIVADNLFLIPIGDRMAIIRPEGLATDWSWQVVKRDDPSVVVDFGDVLIPNATRHIMIPISASKYDYDVAYELRILDNSLAVVSQGEFQCTTAAFGPTVAVTFSEINAEIELALGLAGLNTRWSHSLHDAVTGIPTRSELTVYHDESTSTILARYVLLRRLNKVGQVIGEIMFRTEYNPEVDPSDPSANPSQPY